MGVLSWLSVGHFLVRKNPNKKRKLAKKELKLSSRTYFK
jgi:hypothetical protein